jgi:hypothetical protein
MRDLAQVHQPRAYARRRPNSYDLQTLLSAARSLIGDVVPRARSGHTAVVDSISPVLISLVMAWLCRAGGQFRSSNLEINHIQLSQ